MQRSRSASETIGDDTLQKLYDTVLKGYELSPPQGVQHSRLGNQSHRSAVNVSSPPEFPTLPQQNPISSGHGAGPSNGAPAPARQGGTRTIRPLPPTPGTALRSNGFFPPTNPTTNETLPIPPPPLTSNQNVLRPLPSHTPLLDSSQLIDQNVSPRLISENDGFPRQVRDRSASPVPEYRPNASDDPNSSESLLSQYIQPPQSYTNDPYLPNQFFQDPTSPGNSVINESTYAILRPPSDFFASPRPFYDSTDTPTYSSFPNGINTAMRRENSFGSYRSSRDSEISQGDPSMAQRRNTSDLHDIMNFTPSLPDVSQDIDEEGYVSDETFYINFSLLSNLAVRLRDKVLRGTHVKGSIPYPRAFTGKDIVSTIHSQIQRVVVRDYGGSPDDRRAALLVARSLQKQLFFYEVEWGTRILQDGLEDVYMFLDDQEGGSDIGIEREELPSGVITALTKCYSTNCADNPGLGCYSYSCPRRGLQQLPSSDPSTDLARGDWSQTVPAEVLQTLTSSQINRQTIIQKLISKEEQYVRDLDIVESVFIKPLRKAHPPVIDTYQLDEFIGDVFGNILDIRDCNKGLLDVLYVRQREQAPVIQRIGDIFLDAATDFRDPYPIYIGHYPLAEKRLREEMETNPRFRLFIEECSRKQSMRPGEIPRLDLRHLLNRPGEHLQKYPVLLEAILNEKCSRGDPDSDFILEAIGAINNLHHMAQLRTFQSAMGKGGTGRWEWHDLVPPDLQPNFTKAEAKRQAVIFELIKGEMSYVKDLENIDNIYIQPLQDQEDEPIIPRKRLEQFINDVFHNFRDLHEHHRRLLDALHEIQREQHPRIRSVSALMLNAALNFRDAYMEYIPNYPIAEYRIDNEKATNPAFKTFVERCSRHPESHRLDMKSFINRPIPRLLRYELLLKAMLDDSPPNHEDIKAIPQVIDIIKGLGRETEPGVASAKQKVDLWKYNSNIVFKPGETVDMDLLSEQRSLIYTGKLLRPPESGIGTHWSDIFVLLFDNYLVMTKLKDKHNVLKYQVDRRPIPLDLLSMMNFNDPPTQRVTGLLRTLNRNERSFDRHSDSASIHSNRTNENDSRLVYPFTIHHTGRLGGAHMLYAESAQVRTEWKQKLEESIGLRKVVQESNRVFEVETLSCDTFLVPSIAMGPMSPVWHEGTMFTGKVTCSVPLNTHDGRGLVAIGCAEGVWIGFRHDSRSMRRVLHLRSVTQCAMLEDFGIFLVLADKSLFAYHIEALVPSNPHTGGTSQTPQKLNGSKDVQFFSIGSMQGRTLVAYMRRRPAGSEFHVVEPVTDKINEQPRTPNGLLNINFRSSQKTEWFRLYRDFVLPSDAFDLVFLKAKIAVLTPKGFEIMDLIDLTAVTLPRRDHPQLAPIVKRLDSCKPLGIFKSSETEFLLCYDEFGIFVDKRGGPLRDMCIVEWEGRIERAAFHAPYILLFDTQFIEIRHVETGRLVQIIKGNDLRCVWDGRGCDSTTVPPGSISDENMVQEPRVHAVTGLAELPGNGRSKGMIQHVYELVPTIPLYLPGAISSPPLFPVGFPPSRSAGYFP